MSQSSPFFNRWLSQVGPDQAIAILTDLVDAGAVFAVDASGNVLFWSKGAEKLFGMAAESVLGKPCAQTLGCEEGQDPCGLAELGAIKAQMVKPKRASGERVPCYRTARAFFDAEGRFCGALEFLQPQTATETMIGIQSNGESFHGILQTLTTATVDCPPSSGLRSPSAHHPLLAARY